jgi:hypothetical protein
MSATNATTPVQVTEKKARKPSLSAKYSKFMVFGYNFVQSLRASDILNDEDLENAYAQLKMFDTVDTQSEFYEQFLSQSGESGKVMRKFIAQRNKPPKAPRKPRAKKTATTTTTTTEPADATETAKDKKPRKPRTKKTTEVVQDTQNDIISELVAAANADPLENIAVETTEPAVKEKKARKPRAKKTTEKKATEPATTPEKKSTEPVKTPEKKAPRAPKKKAEKKVETHVEVTPPLVETEELEEEDIVTQEIVIGGETYLIDGDNILYSTQTHEEVGTYNQDTQEISLNN